MNSVSFIMCVCLYNLQFSSDFWTAKVQQNTYFCYFGTHYTVLTNTAYGCQCLFFTEETMTIHGYFDDGTKKSANNYLCSHFLWLTSLPGRQSQVLIVISECSLTFLVFHNKTSEWLTPVISCTYNKACH